MNDAHSTELQIPQDSEFAGPARGKTPTKVNAATKHLDNTDVISLLSHLVMDLG